jgi:hypothetical protein
MLGRLRMDIDECIDTFLRIIKLTFGNPRAFSIRTFPLFYSRAKYNHKALEKEMQDVVRKISIDGLGGNDSFLQPDQVMCRTSVIYPIL